MVAGNSGKVADQLVCGGIHREKSNPGRNDSLRFKNSRKKYKVTSHSFA
jgi:hypothetical protein